MKTKKKIYTAKTYRLKRDAAPLTYMLASHHSRRSPLLYFDDETGTNKQLRYARNQKSPFVEDQDGNAIMEPIIFEDGMLHVPKNNQVLQEFLYYHPHKDMVFEEVNNEKDAQEEVEILQAEVQALIVAQELSLDKLLAVSRILIGRSAAKMSTAELKRDILIYAKKDPHTFMEVVSDPEIEFEDEVRRFFENKLLMLKNNNKDVYYNIPGNKKKMLSVPFNEDYYHVVGSFLKSDDGVDVYKALLKMLKS